MSSEMRQYVEELFALSPWVAFVIAIAWFWVLEMRDKARAGRAYDRVQPRQSDSGTSADRARILGGR